MDGVDHGLTNLTEPSFTSIRHVNASAPTPPLQLDCVLRMGLCVAGGICVVVVVNLYPVALSPDRANLAPNPRLNAEGSEELDMPLALHLA